PRIASRAWRSTSASGRMVRCSSSRLRTAATSRRSSRSGSAVPTVAESLGVYFLDVGQGDCSFILSGSGEEGVLFDCADSDVAQKFATDKGLRELHAVVVSHLDLDHIRGMHA